MSIQDNPVTGRKADVIKAAHLCAEAALRLVKPGNQVKLSHRHRWFDQRATLLTPHLINIVTSLPSEHTGHRSLEQDCKVIQVLPYWGWVFVNVWHLPPLWFQWYTFTECSVTCLTQLIPSMCTGMLSHQLKQHVIDGEKTIIQNPTDQQKWVHSECFLSLTWWVFNQWLILSLCFFFFF